MCGSTWSPANSSPAARSANTTWPRVCPGVCTARSVRSPIESVCPSASQSVGGSQSPGSMRPPQPRAISSASTSLAPYRRSCTACARSSYPPPLSSASDGRSPMPTLTLVPNSRRIATACV